MAKKAAKAKKAAPAERLPVLSLAATSRILDVSTQWLRNLIESGHIKKTGKGVTERDAWRGLLAWTKDEQRRSTKTASTSRMQDARTREIELRAGERERALVDMTEVREVFADWAGAVRTGLDAVPARCTDDLNLRGRIEEEINEALAEAASRFEKAASAGPDAGGVVDAGEEDDA